MFTSFPHHVATSRRRASLPARYFFPSPNIVHFLLASVATPTYHRPYHILVAALLLMSSAGASFLIYTRGKGMPLRKLRRSPRAWLL